MKRVMSVREHHGLRAKQKRSGASMNPIDLGILWGRLISLIDEATLVLAKTAFSITVTQVRDFSNALFDATGNMIGQPTQGLPAFIGALSTVVRSALRYIPAETIMPGDVLITNDPWIGTAQLNDIIVITPIFKRQRLVGYAASVAHAPDIGGRLLSGDSREVYEEGLKLPVMKLFEGGRVNDTLVNMIRANVRVPDIVLGDIIAQVTSDEFAGRRLLEVMADAGLDCLDEISSEIRRLSEDGVKRRIAELPLGTYSGECTTDGFDEDFLIKVTVTISKDTIALDFSGTTPQCPYGVNSTYNYSYAEAVFPVLCMLSPPSPINEGSLRPIQVSIPEGTVLNARFPAALGARAMVTMCIQSAVFQALAAAVPQRVLADSGTPPWLPTFSGVNQFGERFAEHVVLNGGLGARPSKDGVSVLSFPMSAGGWEVETWESEKPFVIEKKELWPDSAGSGRWRGGLGQHFRMRVLSDGPVTMAMRGDRGRNPPRGFLGGKAARHGRALLNGETELHLKRTITLAPASVLDLFLPGGGGFFPPHERDVALVLRDLEDGVVSPEAAWKDYRVQLEAARPDLAPDLAADPQAYREGRRAGKGDDK